MLKRLQLWLTISILPAAEYFVAPGGHDSQTGSREQPFASINKGVQSLQTGDILPILPGKYFESVERSNLGGP